jgi:2-polyprenyl-6-methoxyphenol hydroxylase-like FAD-dependent oxidoreductase
MRKHDVIIVGARCAGAPLAMLLARRGVSVLLVDRARFPSDTMSTHFVHLTGVACLKGWGVLDDIAASGCPPIRNLILKVHSVRLTGSPPPLNGVAEVYCPRRTILDEILVRAARRAGAELRLEFAVRDVLREGPRVVGICGDRRGGDRSVERGSLVVGADGRYSTVARAVAAPIYEQRPTLCCAYYAYWTDVAVDGAEFHVGDGWAVFAFPTHGSLVCTFVERRREQFDEFRSDVEGSFVHTLRCAGELGDRILSGRRVSRVVGTGDLPNYFRASCGPGWALVGDAGHHQDPFGGFGISDAFRDAELLAESVAEGLSGARPFDKALEEYECRRNDAAMAAYELNCQMASLREPNPRTQELYHRLSVNQAATDRFLGVLMGSVPISEFFPNLAHDSRSQARPEQGHGESRTG